MPQQNTSPLTFDFCHSHRLVFHPRTVTEAMVIQQRLANFGIRWTNNDPVGSKLQECVDKGMAVDGGKLFYNPTQNPENLLCSVDQFDKDYVPEGQRFILEQFNKLAARLDGIVDRLERLEEKVDALHGEMFPTVENTKPLLKRKP